MFHFFLNLFNKILITCWLCLDFLTLWERSSLWICNTVTKMWAFSIFPWVSLYTRETVQGAQSSNHVHKTNILLLNCWTFYFHVSMNRNEGTCCTWALSGVHLSSVLWAQRERWCINRYLSSIPVHEMHKCVFLQINWSVIIEVIVVIQKACFFVFVFARVCCFCFILFSASAALWQGASFWIEYLIFVTY